MVRDIANNENIRNVNVNLRNKGIFVSDNWIKQAIDYLQLLGPLNNRSDSLEDKIYKLFLDSDLNECRNEDGMLSQIDTSNANTASKFPPNGGNIILQVDEILSTSQCREDRNQLKKSFNKRILKLYLTDGHTSIVAIELTPIPGLDSITSPGVKISIKGASIRLGSLILTPSNCKVLGGEVKRLVDIRDSQKHYSDNSSNELNELTNVAVNLNINQTLISNNNTEANMNNVYANNNVINKTGVISRNEITYNDIVIRNNNSCNNVTNNTSLITNVEALNNKHINHNNVSNNNSDYTNNITASENTNIITNNLIEDTANTNKIRSNNIYKSYSNINSKLQSKPSFHQSITLDNMSPIMKISNSSISEIDLLTPILTSKYPDINMNVNDDNINDISYINQSIYSEYNDEIDLWASVNDSSSNQSDKDDSIRGPNNTNNYETTPLKNIQTLIDEFKSNFNPIANIISSMISPVPVNEMTLTGRIKGFIIFICKFKVIKNPTTNQYEYDTNVIFTDSITNHKMTISTLLCEKYLNESPSSYNKRLRSLRNNKDDIKALKYETKMKFSHFHGIFKVVVVCQQTNKSGFITPGSTIKCSNDTDENDKMYSTDGLQFILIDYWNDEIDKLCNFYLNK